MLNKRIPLKSKEKVFLYLPIFLSLIGLIFILDSSSFFALKFFNDRFYFFSRQFFWFVGSLFSFFLFSEINLKILKKISPFFFLFSLFLLFLVLIPGIGKEIYGGRRWLSFGNFNFQSSEILKLSLILYLPTILEKDKNLLVFLLIMIPCFALLVLEPDLGTAIIILAVGLSIYFASGVSLKNFLVPSLLFAITLPFLIIFSSYRKERLLHFLKSSFNPSLASYHVKQVLIALGEGGLWGRGFGQSRQKFLFLPEITTDSIFAVIGEEFGFLGSVVLIFLIFFLVYRILKLAFWVDDFFKKMVLVGIGVLIGVQSLVNLGAMVVLIPMKGVPLPFISYGGSSLFILFSCVGLVYNISQFSSERNENRSLRRSS